MCRDIMKKILSILLLSCLLLCACTAQPQTPGKPESSVNKTEEKWEQRTHRFLSIFMRDVLGETIADDWKQAGYFVSDDLVSYLEYTEFIGLGVETEKISILDEKALTGGMHWYNCQLISETGSDTVQVLVKAAGDHPVFYDFYNGSPVGTDETLRGVDVDITADPEFWTSDRCEALLEKARQ